MPPMLTVITPTGSWMSPNACWAMRSAAVGALLLVAADLIGQQDDLNVLVHGVTNGTGQVVLGGQHQDVRRGGDPQHTAVGVHAVAVRRHQTGRRGPLLVVGPVGPNPSSISPLSRRSGCSSSIDTPGHAPVPPCPWGCWRGVTRWSTWACAPPCSWWWPSPGPSR